MAAVLRQAVLSSRNDFCSLNPCQRFSWEQTMQTLAFIGLGNMGRGMAANQARSGRKVHAFDLSETACREAQNAGCEVFASAREAVRGVEAVITMLPAGQHVRSVYAESILPHVDEGALLIDCSTIDVESARAVSELSRSAGKRLRPADAPVSGGTTAADAGSLAFM
ncbi:MAG: NAD(P)-binding domain-containing protein, partial [Pseudomonadota bacterium]